MNGGRGPTSGSLLRRYRAAAGLTQEELAERSGVNARSIGNIECGVSRVPHKDTLRLLADALGLTDAERAAFEVSARRHDSRFPMSSSDAGIMAGNEARSIGLGAPPLVGRQQELTLVEQHMAGDGPPILILAGEPGLGKSRLLGEAARWATSQGWCVLEGGCQRRGSQEPFAPLLGALASFLRQRSPSELRGDLVGCAWLLRLLPELADIIDEALPTVAVPPEQERRLIFAAVTRLLSNVARRSVRDASGGILLLLDDLQWVGSDALDLLAALVPLNRASALPIGDRPLRVVGAYRDTEVRPHDRLAVALADWAHAGLVTHRVLSPLGLDESGRLFDRVLAGSALHEGTAMDQAALRERVLQRAGGVPFFIISYAQALGRSEVSGNAEGVPWDAAQSVRQRVAVLPEAARALLATAAVIGRVSHPALLMAVMARSEDDVLAGLEAACQARLMIDAGLTYHFAHDLVREVVEADLSSARRALLHRRIADAIETLHADRLADHYETLADHYRHAEAWDQAVHYLAQAGDKAVRAGAVHEALNSYDAALAICARLGDPTSATVARVAEKRAFVCYDSADYPGAVADFARMGSAAAHLGDRQCEGLALAYGGMAAYYGHDFAAAEESLRAAVMLAGADFDDVRLFASTQLGSLLMVTNRHAEAQPWLRMAEALAPRIDDPLSRAWWAITGSEELHWRGRYDDALALLEQWQGAVTASNQLLPGLWTMYEAALAYGGKGEYTRALSLLDEVITTCASTGEIVLRARALNTAGWLCAELQDHLHALELNGQSLVLAGGIETADPEIENNARLNLGDSLLALGRLDEAAAQFQMVEHIVRNPRPQDQWMLWRYSQHLFHSCGELWLACDDTEQALAYADECLRGAEASASMKNIAKARRLRGQIFLARSDFAAAESEFSDALVVARGLGNPPQHWKTLVAVGDLRQAQGADAAARQAYREALAIIRVVAAQLPDARLRETLLTSPHVRRI